MPDLTDSHMYCLGCFYDLRGLPEHRCPECGRPFNPAQPVTFSPIPRQERLQKLMHHTSLLLNDALAAMKTPDSPGVQLGQLRRRVASLAAENTSLRIRLFALVELLQSKGLITAEEWDEATFSFDAAHGLPVVDDTDPEEAPEPPPSEELVDLERIVDERGREQQTGKN